MPVMQSYFLSYLLFALELLCLVNGQDQNVQFNQVINLNGDMQLNRLTFPDNSKIETFSQTQRQVLVNQNPSPLTANHVVGSTGGPFVQLSPNSMTIATNGATDLVGAQIEFSIPQATLDQNGVTSDNTFVAMLAQDRQAWVIMEGVKSVNSTDQTVRLVKMTSIDGEFMAVGRKTVETGTVLSPFGSLNQQSVNVSGSGIQEVEFTDGFRMSIRASQPMTVSANVVNGVSSSMANGIMPVNNYRYFVQSNLAGVTTNLNQMMTVVQLPLNAVRVMQLATSMGAGPNSTISLAVAQRSVLQNPGGSGGSLSPQSQPQKRKVSAISSSKVAKATAKASSGTKSSQSPSSTTEPTESQTSAAADASETGEMGATDGAPASNETIPASSASSEPSSSAAADTAPATTPAPDAPASSGAPAQQPPTPANGQNPAAAQLLLSPTFTPVSARTVLDRTSGRIAVPVTQLDGEFILSMSMATSNIAQEGASKAQNGVTVTMAELKLMSQMQKTGGALPVLAMMDELLAQSLSPAKEKKREPVRVRRSLRRW